MVTVSLQTASEKITVVSDDSREKNSWEIYFVEDGNMECLNETELNFLLFLPWSTRDAIIEAENMAAALDNLGYNAAHLFRVFEALEEKWYARTAPGINGVPNG